MEGSTSDEDAVEDFALPDTDICSTEEIESKFSNRYIEIETLQMSENQDVKCSALLDNSHIDYFVAVLSDRTVIVVDKHTFKIHSSYKPHEKEVTDIKFSPIDSSSIYTSSLEGKITLWDLRSKKVERYIDFSKDDIMPLTSFDLKPNGKLLCAGTELVGTDSFLLFWDLRGGKSLGGYFESHSDDISCVKFNPDNSEMLASSGSDCLINIYDITQSSEDKALLYSLNTDDNVNTICWRNENRKSKILAFTDVYSVQIWNTEEGIPSHTFSRESIAKALNRNISYECYPVPLCIPKFDRNPIILAGSGLEHCDSCCLRTLQINEKNGALEPHGLLVSKNDNISSFTQTASYSADLKELITIREDGIASLWREKHSNSNEVYKCPKAKTKKRKINPY